MAGLSVFWKDWQRQTVNILELAAVIEASTRVAPVALRNKNKLLVPFEKLPDNNLSLKITSCIILTYHKCCIIEYKRFLSCNLSMAKNCGDINKVDCR